MIYIKRLLWLLGYPTVWLLVSMLFIISSAFIGFECFYLYIKNGDIQNCGNCFELCITIIYWYEDIEPKED